MCVCLDLPRARLKHSGKQHGKVRGMFVCVKVNTRSLFVSPDCRRYIPPRSPAPQGMCWRRSGEHAAGGAASASGGFVAGHLDPGAVVINREPLDPSGSVPESGSQRVSFFRRGRRPVRRERRSRCTAAPHLTAPVAKEPPYDSPFFQPLSLLSFGIGSGWSRPPHPEACFFACVLLTAHERGRATFVPSWVLPRSFKQSYCRVSSHQSVPTHSRRQST